MSVQDVKSLSHRSRKRIREAKKRARPGKKISGTYYSFVGSGICIRLEKFSPRGWLHTDRGNTGATASYSV